MSPDPRAARSSGASAPGISSPVVPKGGRPSIRIGSRHPRAGRRLARTLLAQGALALLAVLPVRASGTSPPLLEADALAIRFAPVERGLEIRAERIAWRDSSGLLTLRGFRASLRPGKRPGRSALSIGVRALEPGAGAPPLRDLSLNGTFVRAAGKPWAVPDLLLRIAGRDALAGTITGPVGAGPRANGEPGGTLDLRLASREPLDLAALAPALAWAGAAGWRASGTAAITVSARWSSWAGGPLEARAELDLHGFGFTSPGDTPKLAADKLDGHLSITARGTLSPRRLRLDLEAGASDFEFLSGVYYANFAGRTIDLRASGSLRGDRVEGLDARVAAPGLGTIRIEGTVAPARTRPGDTIRMRAEDVDLGRLWPIAVSEPLGEGHRWIRGSKMRGTARLDARWRRSESGWTLEGDAQAKDLRWESASARALLDVPEARAPFHFRSPSRRLAPGRREVAQARYGRIRLARFAAGTWTGGDVVVEPLIQEGGLRLRGPLVIPFYGGAIRIEDLEGSELLDPGRRIRFHGRLAGVDLGAFTRGLGLPDFRGRLDSEIPEVLIEGDHLRAPGRFETAIFGGRMAVSGIEVQRLFSGLPRMGMDLDARELDLSQATEALDLGRMSGTLEGSIRGLVIERGQPQAFFADFDVVNRKGVDKWVSADFVEDVATLFGSGNTVSDTLNRGVNRFIRHYRYDAFGFTCNLENDIFYPRGKIRRGNVEYLMWGRWNYVRIAIRDPGRGIPFSFMVRQVRALAESPERVEQRNRTPLDWLWPPSWRSPGRRPGAP